MEKLIRLEGVAAPLPVDNISTDIISPSILLRSLNVDLGRGLFGPWRYREDYSDNPDFVLNQPRYRDALILVTGKNFGCGSSREQAVWCLQRYGIRCVIAEGFGDIFYESAFKNGLLPIILPEADMAALRQALADESLAPKVTVDLESCRLTLPSGKMVPFAIEKIRRMALMEGLEEIDLMLREDPRIDAHQSRLKAEQPWLFDAAAVLADARPSLPANPTAP